MVRSNSRSHSSRSRSRSCSSSRSRSHSRSRSRKKRYSSRSRSRSYSRSRSRDRNYFRDYRDYRGNRGMRRPYGHRGRGRGYYQGGPRYYRGGYRLNWQNRRLSRSPRRGRSRSRTPKHRSISQRSRSRSRQSRRSSSPISSGSSSSRSSSRHSRSPVSSKQRRSTDKRGKKIDRTALQEETGKNKQTEKSATKIKCDSDSTKVHSESRKTPIRSESWAGLSTYNDNSPRSHHSLSSLPSPSSLSPTCSIPSPHSFSHAGLPRLGSSKASTLSSSLQHSPEQHSSSGCSVSQYSPSQCSPIQKSPAKPVSTQHSVPRVEGQLKQPAFSGDAVGLEFIKSKYLKRYAEKEECRTFVLDRGDGREKDAQKERGLEKDRAKGREWGDKGGVDYGSSKREYFRKEAEKMYLTASPERRRQLILVGLSDELAELDSHRPKLQYTVINDKDKNIEYNRDIGYDEDKYNTKIVIKGAKEPGRFENERSFKFNVASFSLSVIREKLREEVKYAEKKYEERTVPKKESISPEPMKGENLKELYDACSSLPQPKNMDVRDRDKMCFTEESPPRMKTLPTASCQPDVKLKMSASQFEDSALPGSSLTTERLLSSALVHSNTKEQGFRSIFDHLKLPQFHRSSSESFIHHIVTLVQHVKEHYFKSTGMTLNERFTMYQKTAEDHGTRQKSPEIHRRIDISPTSLRKHTHITEEDINSKEENRKAEKKLKCDAADLRHDIDRRRKEKSKEREGSRESSTSKKLSLEKSGKDQKEYKDFKPFKEGSKCRNKDRDQSSCSSTSSPSPSPDSEVRKEKDDGSSSFKSFQGHADSALFQGRGRSRGNFQFRIKGGRGRARAAFSGSSTVSTSTANPNFQKRSKEEEWDPEYTPKSKKYFLHDDRDDGVDYWAKRGRGRGTFPRGRGRFIFKKSSSSPKWTHDKYQGSDEKEEENGGIEDEEERKDRHKEEKEHI